MRTMICIGLASVLALSACSNTSTNGGAAYNVTVTRTTYGIPHIKADDYGSLGYGYGYAFAQDNLCTMMEEFVAIRGERSKYFGGDGTYTIPAVPVTANNVDSDFFFKLIANDTEVQFVKSGVEADAQTMISGFTDGFNRYIRELKAGQHAGAHAACATAAWLSEISTDDLYRRFIRLAAIGSSEALMTEIATAAPPASGSAGVSTEAQIEALRKLPDSAGTLGRLQHKNRKFGSNMYAIGPTLTDSGQPIVYGNPHFPWSGPERLYLMHLTMGDQLNIEGVSLYGTPIALIGFNDHVAWSHTVSTAYRFTMYQLKLNPSNPLQYRYNGEMHDIIPVPLTVQVKNANGSITTQNRTLYRSQDYGPMFIIKQGGIPILGWNSKIAFALRDANLENNRLINQFFEWNKATSLDQFKQLHKSILGVPWVNTAASGPDGHAYYGDVSVVPNVPDSMAQACAVPLFSQLIGAQLPGLPLMDGSRADCQWLTDADAPVAGIFGGANLPTVDGATLPASDDWVANMNDSYWLTNPNHPVTGFAHIIGDEGTARTLRTRRGILQIEHRLDNSDHLGGTTFNLQKLQSIVLSAGVYSGELALQDVTASMCPTAGSYDVANACASLAQWDGAANLDSIGVPVWQEFWRTVRGVKNIWKTPFSVADPVNTPNSLDTSLAGVQKALYTAQTTVQNAGIDFNAPFRDVQHSGVNTATGGVSIPVFGADGGIGAFTVADTDGLTQNGYDVNYGNSYIHTVTWEGGAVHAEGFLTYSESSDPANPHYSDFTQAYSQKQWYRFPFTDAQISAEKESEITLTGTASSN